MSYPLSPELQLALIDRELSYTDLGAFERDLNAAQAAALAHPTADRCLQAAILLCCRAAWREALPLLNQAIAARSEFVAAYAERGLLFGLNEQYPEAMRDLAYAVHVDPTYHRTWAYRAALHAQRGMWGDVIEDSARAIRRAPAYAPPYKLRGIGYQTMRQPGLAVADFQTYLTLCPQASDRAQIRQTIAALEAPAQNPPPETRSWFDRLLGR